MKIKKIVTFALTLALCLSVFLPIQANALSNKSDYFTDAQWEEICDAGYNSSYPSSLDTFFLAYADSIVEVTGAYPPLNIHEAYYGSFLDYISGVKKISSNNNLSDASILARGLYLEVSNLNDRTTSLFGAYDCITNTAESKNIDYMEAAKIMDGLNPYKHTYWLSDVMWNPMEDALKGGSSAMKALAVAYLIGQEKEEENGSSNYTRYSSLSENMYFMNESWGDEKIGDFWFREVY